MCSPKACLTSTPSSPPSASGRARGKKTGTSGRSSTSTASRRCAGRRRSFSGRPRPSQGPPGPLSWAGMYRGPGDPQGRGSGGRHTSCPPRHRFPWEGGWLALRWAWQQLCGPMAPSVRSLSEARDGGGESGSGSADPVLICVTLALRVVLWVLMFFAVTWTQTHHPGSVAAPGAGLTPMPLVTGSPPGTVGASRCLKQGSGSLPTWCVGSVPAKVGQPPSSRGRGRKPASVSQPQREAPVREAAALLCAL